MLWDGKSGLTEAVVMGPGWAILFYRRWSLGEGFSLGKAWDAMFTLSKAISCVGKQVQLNTNVKSLRECWQLFAQAITKWCVEARGPGCPHSHLPALPPFSFHNQDGPPQEERLQSGDECLEEPRHTCQALHHEWGWVLKHGWDSGQKQWDPWGAPTLTPSPSLDCGFKNDRSSVSTSSSVSSRFDKSGGSKHQHHGWCCQEPEGHMKIYLPVFKDDDKKDTVTCQSWHWDIMVYLQARCQDHTLLPYIFCSLQGYPGELVRSLGADVTLHGMLAVLGEHYNNVKALDALNQELIQLWMANKEMVSDWGCTFWGTSKSSQPHSWSNSHQTILLNWNVTTSMVGYLSSWRWWWPTSKQMLMRRHTQTTFEWHGKQRRRWWKPLGIHLQPAQVSHEWLASSLCGSSRAASQS